MNNIQRNCNLPALPGIEMMWVIPQESVTIPEFYEISNLVEAAPTVNHNGSALMYYIRGNNKNQNYSETPTESAADNMYTITINLAIDDNDEPIVNGLEKYVDIPLFVAFIDKRGKMRLVPNATLSANNSSGEDAVGLGAAFVITATLDKPFYFYKGIFTINNDNTLSFS